MITSQNLNISLRVKEFVNELNGRYKDHVSDEFLATLLTNEIKRAYAIPATTKVREAPNYITNLVYSVGAYIFESILEYKCKTGGNGHHVAQALVKKFEC